VDSPIDRRARYDLAHFGEAIGDPSRAAMLVALMGGTARPASDLARIAGVAPSTASSHLQRLEAAGLVVVRPYGRHRYYALAGAHVAQAVESIATGTAANGQKPRRGPAPDDALALARTCYGHLAGRLAVAFWARAREARWVRWSDAAVTLLPGGRDTFARHGLLRDARTHIGRPCLDWSERVPHVAGPLGVALCEELLARGWVARNADSRALRVTTRGDDRLRALGVTWTG
jgi:DNA-binding transcriptional ArsR family regulator